MTTAKRRIALLLGIATSVGFLWFALRETNFAEIGESLAASNPWWILPMLAAYGVYYWIKAVRWRLLLVPIKATTSREIFPPMMIGFFGNNVLPAHLGEFVRMYLGARQLELSNSEVLATIVLERVFDLLAVVLFLGVVLIRGRGMSEDLAAVGYLAAIVGVAIVIVMAIYVTWTRPFVAIIRRTTFFLPHRIRDALIHQLELGALGLQALRRPVLLSGIIVTSVLQWLFVGAAVYMSLISVGAEVGVSAAFVVLAATTFGVTLPAAPGFLGTIQAAYAVALGPYGVSAADAFAASAVFHVPTYLAVTLLGLWYLKGAGYRMSGIRVAAEAAAEAEADSSPSAGR